MSIEKTQKEVLYTPCRAQKCLFGLGESSRKTKLQIECRVLNREGDLSGEESDLGPMSPLDFSDESPRSGSSSPSIDVISLNVVPKKQSMLYTSEESFNQCLYSIQKKDGYNHTRTSLKEVIQAVTHSSHKKVLPDSPKSLSNSPLKNTSVTTVGETETNVDEIVPETPERQFGRELQNTIVETPRKCESPQYNLITPFTSENKAILLPRIHRRKSLNVYDTSENSSPCKKENTLKRRAFEELGNAVTKLLKTDENQSVPKARAALFQEIERESKFSNITLSTKNFYSNSDSKMDCKYVAYPTEQKIQRKGLPGQAGHHKRSFKRHTIGGINAGVSHGIRRRKLKPKTHSTKNINGTIKVKETQDVLPMQNVVKREETETAEIKMPPTSPEERPSSPEIDLTKRFFKIKKPYGKVSPTAVRINGSNRAKSVSDGGRKFDETNEQLPIKQAHKKAKVDISFDATDLTVDEPEIEATIEENRANILKVLEEDWADDDSDTEEFNISKCHISPLKPVMVLKNVTMSPASELSSMTSIMNIKDIGTPTAFSKPTQNSPTKDNEDAAELKYYPLFNKGYNFNKVFNENGKKPVKETLKWQLSAKLNGADNQYQLDAGQKKFGATQCPECGVVYQLGDPEDENAHLNYHNNRKILKFPGWKMERIIMEEPFTMSRVILVQPGDSKLCWKKVMDVLEYVDRDLGLSDTNLSDYERKKVYLYIRDKAVIGVLVAEHITTAHRMIPELLELDCCTAESCEAKCGINVVWTDLKHRKQGIATKLVDILRAHFYFGYIMTIDDIAFSIPTPSGKIFAEKYTKMRNFKVYT